MEIQNQKPHTNSINPDQDQEQELEPFTCEICTEPITLPNNKFKNSDKCVHPFCTDCMIGYIQVKLGDNVSDIKCPHPTCNHSLEPLSCRPKITHQLFDKWCDKLCESAVLNLDGVYCPNKYCSELIVNECGDHGALKRCLCPNCKKPFCFQCKIPWHAAYKCEEITGTMDENDIAFGVLFEREGWKRCPNCRHCVELFQGCSSVICRCGVRFCYKCGKKSTHICRHGGNDFFRRHFILINAFIWVLLAGVLIYFAATNAKWLQEDQD